MFNHSPSYTTMLFTLILQGLKFLIEKGYMRPIDPVVAARTLSATIMGFAALFELGASVENTSPEKLGEQVTDIFLNGLRTHD